MSDRFDPYQEWLGIPPAEQPPHHYRLLGLEPFESDRVAIAQAVQVRSNLIRQADGGRRSEPAMRLLAELTFARQTLIDPMQKQQYDEKLRRQMGQAVDGGLPAIQAARPVSPGVGSPRITPLQGGARTATPLSPVAPSGVPTISAPATTAAAGSKPSGSPASARAQGQPPTIWMVVGGAAMVLVVLVLIFGGSSSASKKKSTSSKNGNHKTSQKRSHSRTRVRPTFEDNEPDDPTLPGASRRPDGARTFEDLMASTESQPQQANTVPGLLIAARTAVADRNVKTARDHVENARRMAKSPAERQEVERVDKLVRSMEEFWKTVHQQCGKLRGGESYEVSGKRLDVVQVSGDTLTLKAEGQNKSFVVEKLPRSFLIVLVECALAGDPKAMHLQLGSFQATDPKGDRQEARQHWDQAGPEGKALLPELSR